MVAGDPGALDRGTLSLAGAAPNYRCYRCADDRFVAVGALEPAFHAQLLTLLGDPYTLEEHRDKARWPELTERAARIFATRTRDEWAALAGTSDACLTPVLTLAEARTDPHMAARGVYREDYGVVQPGPAPRFAEAVATIQGPLAVKGAGGDAMAAHWRAASQR
jgi:alpha-methylacyl-CoA racemase